MTAVADTPTTVRAARTSRTRRRGAGASTAAARTALLWIASAAIGLAVWSFLAWWYGPTTIASPTEVWTAAKELAESGVLWTSIWASAQRILIGWSLGVVIGAPIGILRAA